MATNKPNAPVPGNTPTKPARVADADRKHPLMVRAINRGYYGQIREEGEVFENALDLPIKGSSWLVEAKGQKPGGDEE